MRLAMLPLCLLLAGCLTNEPPPAASTPPAQPAAATAPAATPDTPAPAQRRGAPAATRASNAPPPAPPQPEEPVDPVLQIRQTCWSQGNANKSFRTLEARADWVNGCIAEKMKALR